MIRAALDELADEFREVIVMRDIEGLSYKEIADAADVPIGTVMSRLARARGKLARSLQERIAKEHEMNCDDARILMHGHLDGELDLAADLEIQRHLEECPRCASEYAALRAMRTRLKDDDVSLRGAGGVEGEDSPRDCRRRRPARSGGYPVAAGSMDSARCPLRRADGGWRDARAGHSAAHDRPLNRSAAGRRSGREPRPLADGDASDGRRFDRSAHGQAVVQRQTGFLAAGDRFRERRFSAGGRPA